MNTQKYFQIMKRFIDSIESEQHNMWFLTTQPYNSTYVFKISKHASQEPSAEIIAIDEKIALKKSEINAEIELRNFEKCIVLNKELEALEQERIEVLQKEQQLEEENKVAFDKLSDLNNALQSAVQSEDYEKAARIRDEIKKLKIE